MAFLTSIFAFLSLLGTIFVLMVSMSLSEAENLAMAMLSVVSARSQFSREVARYPVPGLKPVRFSWPYVF